MNRIVLSFFLLVLIPFAGAVTVSAEETAAPADTQAAAPAPAADAAPAAAPAETAPAAPAAPAEAAGAAEDLPAPLDNLDFASGEIAAFDAASGKLDVKVYLDGAGDAKEQTISLTVDDTTEITNGEADLKSDALKASSEIDVEFDTTTQKATYIFIY